MDQNMENKIDPSGSNCSTAYASDLPTILMILGIQEKGNTLHRKQEILTRIMEGHSFMKEAFMKVAHYEFKVCDTFNELKNTITQFSEQVAAHQRHFIMFLAHGTDEGKLHLTREQIYFKHILEMIKAVFQERRLQEELKWPVRCIFAACHSHLIAPPSLRDAPRVLQYTEHVEYAYVTSSYNPFGYFTTYTQTWLPTLRVSNL